MAISIYLDQLHWIHLAQAYTGHKDSGCHKEVLQHLFKLKESERIFCPLSLTHYMELWKTTNYRQRTDVAKVMAGLSGFRTIATVPVLRRAEIEQVLNKWFGKPEVPVVPEAFGFGVFFTVGEKRTWNFQSDATLMQALAALMGGNKTIEESKLELLQRVELHVLRGAHESQVSVLRENYGYAPEKAFKVVAERAARENKLAQQLRADPILKRRLDSIVTANHLFGELSDSLTSALSQIGMKIEDILALGAEGATQFVHNIPTADVLVAFTIANHKNLNRPWEVNDIYDMDALANVIPYCDIVVTEKHAHAQMHRAGMEQKYNTRILRNIEELLDIVG